MKTQICPNCSPNGGAIFKKDFGIFDHAKTKETMTEYDWVMVCTNCHHYKPYRKKMKRYAFSEIMEMPDDSKLRNMKDRTKFHLFSENGYWCQYVKVTNEYVAKTKAKGGTQIPVLMSPYLNDFHKEQLWESLKNNTLKKRDVDYCIKAFASLLTKAKERLEEDFG